MSSDSWMRGLRKAPTTSRSSTTTHYPTLTPKQLAAIAAAGHRRNKLVVAHVRTQSDARDAITAGVDGLVHIFSDSPPTPDVVEHGRPARRVRRRHAVGHRGRNEQAGYARQPQRPDSPARQTGRTHHGGRTLRSDVQDHAVDAALAREEDASRARCEPVARACTSGRRGIAPRGRPDSRGHGCAGLRAWPTVSAFTANWSCSCSPA